MITADNWRAATGHGWRLVQNLSGDWEQDALTVAALVQEHGSENIRIGSAFDVLNPTHISQLRGFAIYARDAEVFLAELEEDLLNYECGHLVEQPTGTFEAIDPLL